MGRELQYIEKLDIYPGGSTIYYSVSDQTVNYVVPVCPGSTYTVTMTEVGNRLRGAFTTANPLTMTSNISCTSIVENPAFSVGYSFKYTPSSYGYLVVYVSNAGEHPTISIVTDGAGGDDKCTIRCTETSSGTSLTDSIFAREGDWVFCTLTTRSNTTLPEGWDVLHVSQATTSSTQHMTLLCRRAESDGMVSFTARQTSSARIYINLVVFRDIAGFRYEEGSEHLYDADSYDSFTVSRPQGYMILWALSSNIWGATTPYSPWSCSEISSAAITLPTTVQRRQANFIDTDPGAERTFIPGATGTSAIIDCVIVLPKDFVPQGFAEYSTTAIQQVDKISSGRIFWKETVPEGTSVAVFAKLPGGNYSLCQNGGDIPGITPGMSTISGDLRVRVEMTTKDPSLTPTVSELFVQILAQGDDHILILSFDPGNVSSIQNAVGEIRIAYDGSGSLKGYGGPVLAFDQTFVPTNLRAKNNQHDMEHLEVSDIQISGALKQVYYSDAQGEAEHVEISDIAMIGTLIHVDDI